MFISISGSCTCNTLKADIPIWGTRVWCATGSFKKSHTWNATWSRIRSSSLTCAIYATRDSHDWSSWCGTRTTTRESKRTSATFAREVSRRSDTPFQINYPFYLGDWLFCIVTCKGFQQISNLKDHMRTHNGEKPYLCSTCGKSFSQYGTLRRHTIGHSGVKSYICSVCEHKFATKRELDVHLTKHSGKLGVRWTIQHMSQLSLHVYCV